ncbi:hypothetical protein B0H13DRAFT_1911134 [Mycena leptocephala]|nr:hypothetical protein B0H13DRAFT_1911134 [Mycena leptocephala]
MESLYRLPSKLLDELRVSSRVYPCPSMINGADWIPPRTSTTMLIIRKVETVIASRPKSVRNYLSPQVSITCYRRTQSVRRSHWSFAVPSPRLVRILYLSIPLREGSVCVVRIKLIQHSTTQSNSYCLNDSGRLHADSDVIRTPLPLLNAAPFSFFRLSEQSVRVGVRKRNPQSSFDSPRQTRLLLVQPFRVRLLYLLILLTPFTIEDPRSFRFKNVRSPDPRAFLANFEFPEGSGVRSQHLATFGMSRWALNLMPLNIKSLASHQPKIVGLVMLLADR